MQDDKPPTLTTEMRCEIADLYFWLGAEAELIGFTPWQTTWITAEAVWVEKMYEGIDDGR